ncbi:hypothetical protein AVEN_92472-1 [Araneus ventricosus]|uniref:Uncharacterized protein n=1 Tax=Araneus ventricosus TaxID=182803 RepID=A0A4Y2AHN7_ARAVE|nr:hypothetical protein AVEN_92472-1 [Araneus ventricosus]
MTSHSSTYCSTSAHNNQLESSRLKAILTRKGGSSRRKTTTLTQKGAGKAAEENTKLNSEGWGKMGVGPLYRVCFGEEMGLTSIGKAGGERGWTLYRSTAAGNSIVSRRRRALYLSIPVSLTNSSDQY